MPDTSAPTDTPLFANGPTAIRTLPSLAKRLIGFIKEPLPWAWLNSLLGNFGDWINYLNTHSAKRYPSQASALANTVPGDLFHMNNPNGLSGTLDVDAAFVTSVIDDYINVVETDGRRCFVGQQKGATKVLVSCMEQDGSLLWVVDDTTGTHPVGNLFTGVVDIAFDGSYMYVLLIVTLGGSVIKRYDRNTGVYDAAWAGEQNFVYDVTSLCVDDTHCYVGGVHHAGNVADYINKTTGVLASVTAGPGGTNCVDIDCNGDHWFILTNHTGADNVVWFNKGTGVKAGGQDTGDVLAEKLFAQGGSILVCHDEHLSMYDINAIATAPHWSQDLGVITLSLSADCNWAYVASVDGVVCLNRHTGMIAKYVLTSTFRAAAYDGYSLFAGRSSGGAERIEARQALRYPRLCQRSDMTNNNHWPFYRQEIQPLT